jgi:hypothetical protein
VKARGNTRVILQKISKIQTLIGEAKALHDDDKNKRGHEIAQNKLDEAFMICIEITGMYEPV